MSLTHADPSSPLDIRHRSFRHHAVIFAVVIALLGLVDWYTAEPYWIHWVFLGWGAGLALHYWLAFRR